MSNVTERFLRYVQLDTESEPGHETVPSTEKQRELGRMLLQELENIGVSAATLDEHSTLYATLPASPGYENAPRLGLIAHMDTSPALSGAHVHPILHQAYDGEDILLNAELGVVLSPRDCPDLIRWKGTDLITTDGTTLLGADDKAGIAEIMTAMETLTGSPRMPHGELRIAFTPDEEVGNGVKEFDLQKFGADFGYTVDGGAVGEISFENFNAASLTVSVQGRSIHPGSAKGKMQNALELLMEFHHMLPCAMRPEYTEGYEGFFHLDRMTGSVDHAQAEYIIRDHDREKFEEKKQLVQQIAAFLNGKYGSDAFRICLSDSYYNMKDKILPDFSHLIENAQLAYQEVGVTPNIIATRGGTDGAMLSWRGLPCPNLGTGGYNFHGRYETIPVQAMELTVQMLLSLIRRYAEHAA